MAKTWKPTVAGILDIIVGGQYLTAGLGLLLIGIACNFIIRDSGYPIMSATVPLFIVGALAIRGGIYALKRKRWGFALAGAIVALLPLCIPWIPIIIGFTAPPQTWDLKQLPFFHLAQLLFPLLLGIAAIVFTVQSKNEFE
ncbi:hypothetical protein ACFLTN_03250 [Chloroflexota bacterium]